MACRTFGWVQDPAKMENLRKTVEIFDKNSSTYRESIENHIPTLVQEHDGRNRFLSELNRIPLRLRYSDLVGTAFSPRSQSRCNGILQAVIRGQSRSAIVNWPADNLLRWAHAFGLIQYTENEDCFSITRFGLRYTNTRAETSEERQILDRALLSYPPAIRVLNLLADGSHLTKFEIGKKLGFVGEDGFTSLSQDDLVRSLARATGPKERNKLLTDSDGTSDKYARTIASWLKHMGWARQSPKRVIATLGDETCEDEISQAYSITRVGLQARKRGLATNTRDRIPKNVFWEMLATKGRNRNLVRTRRALIIQKIAGNTCLVGELRQHLEKNGLHASEATIINDLNGLERIGLNIQLRRERYNLQDTIQNLVIPTFTMEIPGDAKFGIFTIGVETV